VFTCDNDAAGLLATVRSTQPVPHQRL